jgi:hypothetical protein
LPPTSLSLWRGRKLREHYGFPIGESTIQRITLCHAEAVRKDGLEHAGKRKQPNGGRDGTTRGGGRGHSLSLSSANCAPDLLPDDGAQKTENGYPQVVDRTVNMRKSGRLAYEFIVDNTRSVAKPLTLEEVLTTIVESYRKAGGRCSSRSPTGWNLAPPLKTRGIPGAGASRRRLR